MKSKLGERYRERQGGGRKREGGRGRGREGEREGGEREGGREGGRGCNHNYSDHNAQIPSSATILCTA